MRIGILTQPLRANYGGLIQNYALQTVLKRMGHAPITLDQTVKDMSKLHVFLARAKGWLFYMVAPKKNKKPRYNLSKQEDLIIRKHSISFINKYIEHSMPCTGTKDFQHAAQKYKIECYVVGSDQCWRPCYNIHLKDMFLNFCKDMDAKKRIAYAASFGSDLWEFSSNETKVCAALARYFDKIFVREDSGVKLCKKYLGVPATHVVDPTLLLTKDDYIELIKENNVPESDGKLFNYVLDPSNLMSQFIEKVSKESGYKTFQILPKFNEDHRTKMDVKTRIEECVYPSPLSWLRAFMDSEMTIVDSFHGTVFSIIFNKPFWVIGNKERGLSRFSSLLSMFELEDRLIDEKDLKNLDYNKPIDWKRVNNILDKKRTESLELLKSSLE